jgi:hypothetical protein
VAVAAVGASSNRVCGMCPTVATGEAHPLLLEHHSSDGTAAADRLHVDTEGYGPLVQRHIVVVPATTNPNHQQIEMSNHHTSTSGLR